MNFILYMLLASVSTITLVPYCENSRHYEEGQRIELCLNHSKNVLVHELGHSLHNTIGSVNMIYWRKLHNICNNRNCFVSEYAMTHENEDFADTFLYLNEGIESCTQGTKNQIKVCNKKKDFVSKMGENFINYYTK